MAANDAAQNVDRGFSESELADIMSEIDTLESQFTSSDAGKKTTDNILEGLFDAEEPKAVAEPVKETPKATPKLVVNDPLDNIAELTHDKLNIDEDINEVVQALESKVVEKTVKQPSVKESSKLNIRGVDEIKPRVIKTPVPAKVDNEFAQLNFKIKHDTKMQLNFSLEEQVFSVFIDAENNLTMELGNGIEFSFPLQFKK